MIKSTNKLMIIFSVIIPTCARNASLSLCLDRLQPGVQTLDASKYEVIVSDDGKGNEAKALIETSYPWVTWVEGPKRGPAANRNNGARRASGTWLVFTDDDCLPDSKWLMAYADAIAEHPNGKAFEGAILPDDWNLLKKDMAECPVNTSGGCFWSANIMIEKRLFDAIGGFDEQFKIAAQEDQDLQIQVLKQTGIVFIKEALVVHPVRVPGFNKALSQVKIRTMNYLYYATKNRQWLGYKNTKEIAGKRGLRIQAIALAQNLKKGHWKRAMVTFYNFLVYLPIYIKS
jgi:GT2 family glycosyltransferase